MQDAAFVIANNLKLESGSGFINAQLTLNISQTQTVLDTALGQLFVGPLAVEAQAQLTESATGTLALNYAVNPVPDGNSPGDSTLGAVAALVPRLSLQVGGAVSGTGASGGIGNVTGHVSGSLAVSLDPLTTGGPAAALHGTATINMQLDQTNQGVVVKPLANSTFFSATDITNALTYQFPPLALTPWPGGPPSPPPPHSSAADALDLGAVQGTATTTQTLQNSAQVTWLTFRLVDQAASGQGVDVALMGTHDEASLALYDADLNLLGTGASDGNGGLAIDMSGARAGRYYLVVTGGLDASNLGYTATVTGPTTTLPDLAADLSFVPATVYAGQPFPLTLTVTNVGSAAAPATEARLTWSRDRLVSADAANVVDPSNLQVPALAPGQSFSLTLAVTLPTAAAGTVFLGLTADYLGQVPAESSTDDNLLTRAVDVLLPPDPLGDRSTPDTAANLGPLAQTVTLNNLTLSDGAAAQYYAFYLPTTGAAGDAVNVTLANGTGHLDVQILDASLNIVAASNALLDPDGTDMVDLTGLAPGAYYVRVAALGGIPTGYTLELDSSLRNGAQLVPLGLGVPTTLVPTIANTLDVTVANDGSAIARGFEIQAVIQTASGDVPLGTPLLVDSLAAGATQTYQLQVTPPASFAGQSVTIRADVDPTQQVAELDPQQSLSLSTTTTIGLVPSALYARSCKMVPSPWGAVELARRRLNGLDLVSPTDRDVFTFILLAPGQSGDQVSVALQHELQGNLEATLYDASWATRSPRPTRRSSGVETISLNGVADGTYTLVIQSVAGSAGLPYTLTIAGPQATGPDLGRHPPASSRPPPWSAPAAASASPPWCKTSATPTPWPSRHNTSCRRRRTSTRARRPPSARRSRSAPSPRARRSRTRGR